MRIENKFVIVLALVLMSGFSCSRKSTPSITSGIQSDKYDSAQFEYIYVEALKQKTLGNEGDALKYLQQCSEINPKSDAVYFEMAKIVAANGDLINGKKYALKATSLKENNLWYLTMIAGLYYQEKKIDSAIYFYEKAVKFYPENESLQLTLGNLYSENKEYEKASVVFDSFDRKYGINATSTLSGIKNLMAEGKYDEALIKADMLIKQFPDEVLYNGILADIYRGKGEPEKALEVYNNLLERNPENPQIQLSLCDFLVSEKRYDELLMLLNTVFVNNSVSRDDKISFMARLLEQPDMIKEDGSKLLVSLMVLEAAYKGDNIVPLLRPELLIKMNRLTDAATRLEEITKEFPENYYAWEKLLFIYLEIKDYTKLMSKGNECATRFNMSFVAKILYANGAMENGKFDIAVEELRKAEILAGSNKDSLLQVLVLRADVYYRMKDYTKAFETFDEALKYNKDDVMILNNYSYFLAEQNMRLKEAETMAKKVIEKEKDNMTYLDTYAWVLYKRGKIKESEKVMERIIASGEKDNAEWYEHYGFILKARKLCREAVENWNFALKLDPRKTYLLKEIEDCGQ